MARGVYTILGKVVELGGKVASELGDGAKAFGEAVEENIHTAGRIVKRTVKSGGLAGTVARATKKYVEDMKDDPLQTMLSGGLVGEIVKEVADPNKENLKDIYNITINSPAAKAGEAMVKGKPKK